MSSANLAKKFALQPIGRKRQSRAEVNPEWVVYVVGPSDSSAVKIGVSSSVYKRLRTLQGSNEKELMLHFAVSVGKENAYKVECRAHKLLANQRARQIGEWFEVNTYHAAVAVLAACSDIGCVPDRVIGDPLHTDGCDETEQADLEDAMHNLIGLKRKPNRRR